MPELNGKPENGTPKTDTQLMAERIALALAAQTHDDDEGHHGLTGTETPMRPDAFALSDTEKMDRIEEHFAAIMDTLGLDLSDDSLKGTPRRVAKMYVQEIFKGLDPKNKPSVTLFENRYQYGEMLVERDITVYSHCEHHFVPIVGKAHVAYYSTGKVVGLSKLNRIVQYYAKRPQVQERLTVQIGEELKCSLGTDDVAVLIDAAHLCVSSRGINDTSSSTVTSFYSGKFEDEAVKARFITAAIGLKGGL